MKITSELKGQCGIYCLLNTNNGKRYVGLSTDLYTRIMKHRSLLKHNKHYNKHLQAAYNKGYNFEVIVLENCSIEELDTKEVFYMNLYNVLNPEFGYNLAEGGGLGNGLKGEQSPAFNSNIFTFYNEDGRVETNKTCYYMINKYNLSNKIYSVANGKITSTKGWRCSIDKVWEKRYDFYNIDGRIDKGLTQKEMCNKYNLDSSSISRVVRGLLNHCGGWSITPDKKCHREARNKKYSVCNETGTVLLLNKTIKEIAQILNCSTRVVNQLCRGKIKTVKGYKLINN